MLKLKIQRGEYTVGELVVPRKYEKLVIDKEGNIVKTEFVVEGRKQPLEEIRKRMIEKHRNYMRQHEDNYYDEMQRIQVAQRLEELGEFEDEEGLTLMRKKLKAFERSRNLLVWHDHSTVANHGHLVFMVSAVYDPALYLTPDEYHRLTGFAIDVQAEVERPEIYIVGRCRSTDVEQLAYCETRCECLQDLHNSIEISPGITITDTMRFFKGDGPAVAFEVGQQKGGHYFCSACGMHAILSDDLDHFFRCKHVSLSDRQILVLNGPQGRSGSKKHMPKPFEHLKKKDIQAELRARKLLFNETNNKSDYEKELKSELKGVQRVPALLFLNPTEKMANLNIASYEALPCEPMHDISNHIGNILEEIPSHLTKEQKNKFNEILQLTLGDKEVKRATDHRAALVIFSNQLRGHVSETLQSLLDTLSEMQAILYSNDIKRCPRLILRYHNVSFLHFVMCN